LIASAPETKNRRWLMLVTVEFTMPAATVPTKPQSILMSDAAFLMNVMER
jgi:hypothetical protein